MHCSEEKILQWHESNLGLVSRPCHLSHNQFPGCWQGLFLLCVHSQCFSVYFYLFLCVCRFFLLPLSPYQFTGSCILFVQRNRQRKRCGGYQTMCQFARVSVDVRDSCSLLDIFFCQSGTEDNGWSELGISDWVQGYRGFEIICGSIHIHDLYFHFRFFMWFAFIWLLTREWQEWRCCIQRAFIPKQIDQQRWLPILNHQEAHVASFFLLLFDAVFQTGAVLHSSHVPLPLSVWFHSLRLSFTVLEIKSVNAHLS